MYHPIAESQVDGRIQERRAKEYQAQGADAYVLGASEAR
jgi:pentose-5-phosphate-3-epimerase